MLSSRLIEDLVHGVHAVITGQNQRWLQPSSVAAALSAAKDTEWASDQRYRRHQQLAWRWSSPRFIMRSEPAWSETAVGRHSKATKCWQGEWHCPVCELFSVRTGTCKITSLDKHACLTSTTTTHIGYSEFFDNTKIFRIHFNIIPLY